MAVSKEKIDEFHRNSGEVLRLALEVEAFLDHFFYNYFCKIEGNRLIMFNEILLPKLRFEDKTQIFRKICKYEQLNAELAKSVLDSIKFIQESRNKVAHGTAFVNDVEEGYILHKGGWITATPNELKLDLKFMEEIRKKKDISIQGIDKLLDELFNPDRFKKGV